MSPASHNPRFIETIGVGFGPAALGLAAALEDATEAGAPRPDVLFLERREDVSWQPDMLLPEANIQHHFLRDLATPRNPRSKFTFANYLKQHDRIYSFGELVFGGGSCGVSRIEWADYVEWVGKELADWALFGESVEAIEAIFEKDILVGFHVRGGMDCYRCRNVVFASGPVPHIPNLLRGRTIHSANYLEAIASVQAFSEIREVAVVGSGQSAIEITDDLARRFLTARIHAIHRGKGFSHVDRSQFSNRAFHPEHIDRFHGLPASYRRSLLETFRSLNYGVVEIDTAYKLYRRIYEDEIHGAQRICLYPFTEITAMEEMASHTELRIVDRLSGSEQWLKADLVVACTGFEDVVPPPYAQTLNNLIKRDEMNAAIVRRDYELELTVPSTARLFAAGMSSTSHGVSDSSSFSMIAERASRISQRLVPSHKQPASGVPLAVAQGPGL
jgi:L-ornithine N5-oxygenase